MSKAERIIELENLIRHHNDLYWNGRITEISDIEYDLLVEELRTLDPNNKLLETIGCPVLTENEKLIKHSKPMLSLGKVYSKEDLLKWIKKISRSSEEEFIIQPKYDGMSGLLENGTLSSRGDGVNGQDYTDKLKIIEFDSDHDIDVENETLLGEILIRNDYFKNIFTKVKSKSGIPFKNQRNGIAGILGTDDVDFYYNQGARITFVDYNKYSWSTTCENFIKDWESIVNTIRTTTNYPLDGIVIKLADAEYSDHLGYTTHHPRGQIAYKFTNQMATSKLIGIEWGMGKKQISAIGIIKPVDISGITIKRVKLQLTKPKSSSVETCLIDGSLQIGDNVVVERAGDIIPHIVSSTPGEHREPVILNECPFCHGPINVNETSVECANPEGECIEQRVQNIYCAINTLGFKNIGESYIKLIINDGFLKVKNIADLLSLKPEQMTLKEYGTKRKEIFFKEIEKAKNTATKDQVLAAINLDNIGKTVAKLLVNNFNWAKLIEGLVTDEELKAIPGIGPSIIEVYHQFNPDADGIPSELTKLMRRLTPMFKFKDLVEEKQKIGLGENSTKTICFTGKMEHKRSEMEEIAKKYGLTPVDHVDKNLNILVCADPNSGSSKMQKAIKFGIKVISEKDFLEKRFTI